MIRFTKNLLSNSPTTVIEIDELSFDISTHQTVDNIFKNESRTCKISFFNTDDFDPILSSDRIMINKMDILSDNMLDWQQSDYSVYQAQIIKDNVIKFTGLVLLSSIKKNLKNQLTTLTIYDTTAILSEVGNIKIGSEVSGNGSHTPFYQDLPAPSLLNIAMDGISSLVKGNNLQYTFVHNKNYTDVSGSDIPELTVAEDFSVFQYQCGIDFQEHWGEVGTVSHSGYGFRIIDNQLCIIGYAMLRDVIPNTTRETADFAIHERIYYSKKNIYLNPSDEEDWFSISANWSQITEQYDTTYTDNDAEQAFWNSLQSNQDWLDIFAITNDNIAYQGYVIGTNEYIFTWNGFNIVGSQGLIKTTKIPFKTSHDNYNILWHGISDVIKMGIFTIGVKLSCNHLGNFEFTKLSVISTTTHSVENADVLEYNLQRISNRFKESDIAQPFETLGFEEDGVGSDMLDNIINRISSFYKTLFSTNFEYALSTTILNEYNFQINDNIIILGKMYKIRSFKLESNDFSYKIKAWSI